MSPLSGGLEFDDGDRGWVFDCRAEAVRHQS
jgi:hypothetical protein